MRSARTRISHQVLIYFDEPTLPFSLATKFPGKTNWKNLIVFLAINSQETEDFQMLIFLLQPSNPEKLSKFSTYTKKGLKVWFLNILSENMAFYKKTCHWYWNIYCLIKHAIKTRQLVLSFFLIGFRPVPFLSSVQPAQRWTSKAVSTLYSSCEAWAPDIRRLEPRSEAAL